MWPNLATPMSNRSGNECVLMAAEGYSFRWLDQKVEIGERFVLGVARIYTGVCVLLYQTR